MSGYFDRPTTIANHICLRMGIYDLAQSDEFKQCIKEEVA